MKRRELVKAADELLGPDYKLRPLGKRMVKNPDYKVKSVDWTLKIYGNSGELKIVIGKKDKKPTITLPCNVYQEDLFGERLVVEVPTEVSFMFNTRFIEYVCQSVSQMLSGEKNGIDYLEGTMLIPPKILGIPKTVLVEELSLEGLQEGGLLPMDLEQHGEM